MKSDKGWNLNTQTQAIEGPKKTYTSPRLINYGEVRQLTQAGTLGVPEAPSSSPNKRA